jgi:hypothetical protein
VLSVKASVKALDQALVPASALLEQALAQE